MSASSLVQLGTCLSRASTWNPLRASADDLFRYIDLSSVDQDTKAISDAREVACGEAPSRARQLVAAGDVLVSTVRPNLNGVARVPPDLDGATASTGFCVLRPEPKKLDGSYLFQWVKSSAFISDMVSKATGASYPAVSDRIIFESPIPLPSLQEQRRIAAILDLAETLRTQRRQALAHLDTLSQSLFLDMFGDPVTNPKGFVIATLADVSKFENGDRSSNYPSGEDIKTEGVLFLSTKNIVASKLDLSKPQFITQEKFKSLSRGKAQSGDLIITLRGTLGSCCIFDCEEETAFINAQMMIIRPTAKVISQYLHSLLTSDEAKAHFDYIGRGAAVPQLTAGQLGELKVLLPPIALQQTFATRIQAIEALKATHRTALAQLDALFASLQQRAFSGELTRTASATVSTRTKPDLSALCTLDVKKMLEAMIYVAKRMPGHDFYKSLKALYAGDRQHLEHHGCLIYGETYEALEHGPVPKAAYALTKQLEEAASSNLFADDALSIPLRRIGNQLIPARDADFGLLSAAERKSLDWAIQYFAPMRFGETKTATHDSAYLATAPNAPLAIEAIIRTLPEAAQRRFFA